MNFSLSMFKLSVMALFYANLYNPINILLNKNKIFKSYPLERKNYITKNLIKTASMCFIFYNFIKTIYPDNFYGFLTNDLIRDYGAIYVGNDIAGLFMVKKLPKSTKFHHLMSLCLYSTVSYLDIEKNDIVKMIAIYTIFSFIPYSVNCFLALRFFVKIETNCKKQLLINKLVNVNRICAKYTYLITCMCNWIIHLRYFIKKILYYEFNIYHLSYMLLLIPIINDDIVLLRWLNKKL
mgnify:CR=1 FL=1|jgi:hypothetical protein